MVHPSRRRVLVYGLAGAAAVAVLHHEHLGDAFGQQRAPAGHGRLDAQPEEAQERFVEHDGGHRQREINHHDAEHVRDDMPSQNPKGPGA